MARVQLPESRLRARKRRRRNAIVAVWAVLILAIAGLVVGIAHLPHLRVVQVEVAGVEGAEAKAVEKAVLTHLVGQQFVLFPRSNVLMYPRSAIVEDLLAEFSDFSNVQVRATTLRALRVEVTKRTPKAVWCGVAEDRKEPCLLLDQKGVAYEMGAQFAEPVYTTYYGPLAAGSLPRQYTSEETFRSLVALVAALEERQGTRIVSVVTDQAGDARVHFIGGFELIFALQDGGGDVFERFMLALGAEPFAGRSVGDFEYLDLRFGDRLYYKLKGE